MDSGMLKPCWQPEVFNHVIFQAENTCELYSSPHVQGCFVQTCSCHEINGQWLKTELFPLLPAQEAPGGSWSGQKITLQFSTGLVSNLLVYPQVSKYWIDVLLLLSTPNIPNSSDALHSFPVFCSRLRRRGSLHRYKHVPGDWPAPSGKMWLG